MSGDEMFVLLVSLVLGPIGWAFWLFRSASIDGLRKAGPLVPMLGATIGLAGALIFFVLTRLAADDVRDAPQYLLMYFLLGLAWVRVAAFCFPLLGLNPRDDVIERRNRAALPAFIGAIVGVTLCFAGANIGNGPGWWVVVFAAGLASAALAGIWLAAGQWSGVVDFVTIDRDVAAGWRLGGLLVACGLIFGAAVAGDWVSAPATVADFIKRGWPALVIAALAIQIERVMQPRPDRPTAPVVQSGLMLAALYVALAVAGVEFVGITL